MSTSTREKRTVVIWVQDQIGELLRFVAEQAHLDVRPASSWRDLKRYVDEGEEQMLVVVDALLVEESLEGLCRRILKGRANCEVLIVDRPRAILPRKVRDDLLSFGAGFTEKYAGRVRFWAAQGDTHELLTRLQQMARAELENVPGNEHRILPVEAFGPTPDPPLPPNPLSRRIGRELSTLSASSHLTSRLLRENFVQMLADEAEGSGPASSKEAVAAWRRYVTNLAGDAARDHASEIDPDRGACARFSDVILVENRMTYLALGERGCGKTTFLHYFFDDYLPEAYPHEKVHAFFVDFLKYDFVRDAHTLAAQLQNTIFDALRSLPGGKHRLPYKSFADYVRSSEYRPTALLHGELPDDLDLTNIREFLSTVLSGVSDDTLLELYYLVEGRQKEVSIEDAWVWRNRMLVDMPVAEVCAVVAHFAEQSLERRESIIAESIYNQATRRSEEIARLLRAAGLDPLDLSPRKGLQFEQAVRHFLVMLAQEAHVFLVIDNADRAVFRAVELEIFRTSWAFLPEGMGDQRVRFVFSMRSETYNRHHEALTRYDFPDDIRDVANVYAGLVLQAPDFLRLAQVRVSNLKAKLEAQGDESALRALDEYVGGVLQSEVAGPLFRTLFGGDLRRSLEWFELAVASPHMAHTDAYFYANDERRRPESAPAEFVRAHRLLTSLMLGPWRTFRQRRSLVFLNVYNAQLDVPPDQMWRNTLLIPRLLGVLERHGRAGGLRTELTDLFVRVGGYTERHVIAALQLLVDYRLASGRRRRGDLCTRVMDAESLALTPCGHFYVRHGIKKEGLMHRLEYLQAVYWEIFVPRRLYFTDFEPEMNVRYLGPFVSAFCDLIRSEEMQETAYLSSEGERMASHITGSRSLASQIGGTAWRQLWAIYMSRRDS